jgi:membrane-associated phospholipid phosphatase
VFYGLRGVFLFVLPLGMPPTAPPLESRFVLWPFPGHAYFPGGHTGMMTVLSLSVISRSWRRAFLVATFAFAFGTLLSRTHYTGDALGGWCIGYAIVLWGRRHVVMRPASYTAKNAGTWSAPARHEQEA